MDLSFSYGFSMGYSQGGMQEPLCPGIDLSKVRKCLQGPGPVRSKVQNSSLALAQYEVSFFSSVRAFRIFTRADRF